MASRTLLGGVLGGLTGRQGISTGRMSDLSRSERPESPERPERERRTAQPLTGLPE